MWTPQKEERLIELVRDESIIWDRHDMEHDTMEHRKMLALLSSKWQEIAIELRVPSKYIFIITNC